jgi:uncharacterized membrane protein
VVCSSQHVTESLTFLDQCVNSDGQNWYWSGTDWTPGRVNPLCLYLQLFSLEVHMNATNQLIHGAIASLLALGIGSAATSALAQKAENEKCAGIVKAGKNDCGTSKGSCAGTATADRDPEAWIYVPKGTCQRLAGGTVTNKPENVPGGAAGAGKKGG